MGDIWQAARSNNVGKVKLLLESGVSPNATRWSGVTPLHRAAETNSCHVAQVLINAGADVNGRTAWGWYSPLHLAAQNGHEQVAEVLLKAGARWRLLTKRLQSPYDLAVARGREAEALRMQKPSAVSHQPISVSSHQPSAIGRQPSANFGSQPSAVGRQPSLIIQTTKFTYVA
ncbi:unnamed protein product [Ascophyllum nodosum]